MPGLLKCGQSASREEAVEEMKDCRSTKHPCHRSTVHTYEYQKQQGNMTLTSRVIGFGTHTNHPGTVHVNTVHPKSIDTVHPPSIDTVHTTSIDTVHRDTVHHGTVHHGTVHPMTDTTCLEAKKVEVLMCKVDENGMLRDKECRTRNSA
ncbi:hypothetical protein DY000_02033297 [Brassica cretica]|uniref:BURP domain-containing protein n=1 Tax=Brassica cretica TaxID=69181 RepID=A0ABQ7DIG9_BRACR|nr:hypothetical protein DY000_02033297 [Brassica cretica]